jgi:uncharacterized protein
MSSDSLRASHTVGWAADPRLAMSLKLVAAIWLTAVLARLAAPLLQALWPPITPELTAWPALLVYVIGSLALAVVLVRRSGGWESVGLRGGALRRSLAWGFSIGVVLMALDWFNTYSYYRAGNGPMVEMERLLVELRLIVLFPALTLAEELLWRGILARGLQDAGMNRHLIVALTTAAYAVNHFFVAPVGVTEQALMTMMALPIGIIGGYLTLATRNVSGALLLHLLTVVSMIVDIYWMPALAAMGS